MCRLKTAADGRALSTGRITAAIAAPGRALTAASAAAVVAATLAANQRSTGRSCRPTLRQLEAGPPLLLAALSAAALQLASRRVPQVLRGQRLRRTVAADPLARPQHVSSQHVPRAPRQQEGAAAASPRMLEPASSAAAAGRAAAAGAALLAEAAPRRQVFPCRARSRPSQQRWRRSPPSPAAGCLISWLCAAPLAQSAAAAAALWRMPDTPRRVLQGRTCRSCWRSPHRRWMCLRCTNEELERPNGATMHSLRVATTGQQAAWSGWHAANPWSVHKTIAVVTMLWR